MIVKLTNTVAEFHMWLTKEQIYHIKDLGTEWQVTGEAFSGGAAPQTGEKIQFLDTALEITNSLSRITL